MSADFSKCSTWIRSNCVNNELHYFRANSGEVNAGKLVLVMFHISFLQLNLQLHSRARNPKLMPYLI